MNESRIISNEIERYEETLSAKIEPELLVAIAHVERVIEDIKDYNDLLKSIRTYESSDKPIKTTVDIGSECKMNAVIKDTTHIFIEVGLSFFFELSTQDAIDIINRKIKLLEKYNSIFLRELSFRNYMHDKINNNYEDVSYFLMK